MSLTTIRSHSHPSLFSLIPAHPPRYFNLPQIIQALSIPAKHGSLYFRLRLCSWRDDGLCEIGGDG